MSTPARQAQFIRGLADELVTRWHVPRPVVRQLRLEALLELVAAYRLHGEVETRDLMAAPKR